MNLIRRRLLTRMAAFGAAAPLVPAAARAHAADAQASPRWPPAEHFRLWPAAAPGAPAVLPTPVEEAAGRERNELWLRGIATPTVAVFRAARPDGRAVLVMPGGGYSFLSATNEGVDVAAALNAQGITVFVLAYRLPGEGWARRWDVPLQDAQRAMRLIRMSASSWSVDPARLGVLGFSAGGHLAADLAVGHGDAVYAPIDAADRVSARPAFTGLVYPVVSFATAGPNSRSGGALLGDNRDPSVLARHTPLDRVHATTPPIFLAHAMDDGTVPVTQSIAMAEACRRAGVPVEAHLFQKGGHGFGISNLPPRAPARLWPDLFARWMEVL
ncbi:alpha/beta hydrolase [Sphingomonas sp. RS6]